MTRQDLLNRLLKMQEQGEDMTLPVVARISRKIPDRRTGRGYRLDYVIGTVDYAANGTLTLANGLQVAELIATELVKE